MRSLKLLIRGNSTSDSGQGQQVIGVVCAALILPYVAVSLRIYVRFGIQKRFGKDDYFAILSLLVFSALCGLLIRISHYVAHATSLAALSLPSLAKISHIVFACEILYIITTALTKLSVGFYFLRLTQKQYQRKIIYATMIVVGFVSIIYLAFTIFQCLPVDYLWRKHESFVTQGSCSNQRNMTNMTYVHASMICITDWMFGVLPLLFLWKLDMKFKTKLSVMIILSLGIVASIATIIRMFYVHTITSMTNFGNSLTKWSVIESSIALTTATIATLRPLTQRIFSSRKQQTRKLPQHSIRILCRKSSVCHSSEFAEMLGLATSPVVKTLVYADNSSKSTNPPSPLWSGWRDSPGGPTSPLWNPPWRCGKNDKINEHHGISWNMERGSEKSERTVSLGLRSLRNGSWVASKEKGSGITRTVVVTRDVGMRGRECKR